MRKFLLAGLLVWIPLALTLWLLTAMVGLMDKTLLLLPTAWQPAQALGFELPGLGVLLTAAVLLGTGVLATNFMGQAFLKLWGGILERLPLVSTIYTSIKQVSDTLLASDGKAFREAVLVPYPHPGLWSLGFLTSEAPEAVNQHIGEGMVSVYIPTALSPTAGFVVMLPAIEVKPSGMSVDEALKYIVSMGVVTPTEDTTINATH